MLSLRSLVDALGGGVVAGQLLAPGPGHGPRDRSLSVRLCATSPDGFVVHSFAGDNWRDCRDHVRKALGIEPARRRAAGARPEAPEPRPHGDEHNARALAAAAAYVAEMRPVRGRLGERYLHEARKIDTDAIADVLERTDAIGWHPAVYFNQPGHALHGRRLGCIIGVMTESVTAKTTGAISRTYIDESLHKVCKARTLGSPAGIVRLTPDEDVTNGLCLVEGLETALSAMMKGLRPIWSTGSTALLKTFAVLDGIDCLTVIADRDASAAGEYAARQVEARWRQAGRKTRVFIPESLGDLNDLLQRARG